MRWRLSSQVVGFLGLMAVLLLPACSQPAPATPAPPTAAAPAPASPVPPTVAKPTAAAAAKPAVTPSPALVPMDKPLDPPVKVQAGVIHSLADAGIYIAAEKGYFRAQGLDVELQYFDSAATQIAPLAAGQLEVGAGTINAALFNAIARGIDLKVVAEKGSAFKDASASAMVVRKDLVDSGRFKELKDLKGLRVAISATGASTHVNISETLQRVGLADNDVELIAMPFGDMGSALANQAVDVAMYQEPFTTQVVERGIGVRFLLAYDLSPDQTVAGLLYGPRFIQEKPEAARRFVVAYLQGVRDYNNAFLHNQKRAEIIPILVKYTTVKDPGLYDRMVPGGLNSNGYVNVERMKHDEEWYVEHGFVQQMLPIEQVVDHQYVEYALQRLGKVQR